MSFFEPRNIGWARVATFLLALVVFAAAAPARAQQLDEMSLDRWKKLRETERYQMQVADNYYRDRNFKVALSEYEKFLSLYEKSEGSSYAQLRWSICQVQLRKHNTAIKEGFQTVIDYWPESPEAVASAYYIGHTYKSIGQIPKAKAAFREVLSKHADQLVSAYAMSDLVDIATLEKDTKTRVELLRKLTFDVKRTSPANGVCVPASQQLATHYFDTGVFDEGQKALATTYPEPQLPGQVVAWSRQPIARLVAAPESKAKGEKLADAAVAYLRTAIPLDLTKEDTKLAARQTWYGIADMYAVSLRDDKALEAFDQMTKAVGPSDETLGRLAQFYKSRQKFEDARATFRRYQNAIDGLGQVAYSYREQANNDAAIQTYQQLLTQDAQNTAKWKAEMAVTYRAARKFPEAVATYAELIAQDSANANKWRWELACTHRDAGQYKEAIGHFRQTDIFPEAYKQMAWCHRQLKEYNEAVLLYNQVVGSDQASAPWALLQAGYTREEAGQKEAAIQTFQQVCRKFPKDGHASTAHAHLQTKYKISVTLGGAKDD